MIDWTAILLFGFLLITFGLACMAFYLVWKGNRHSLELERLIEAAHKDAKVLCKCAVGVGRRLIQVEKQFHQLQVRQDEMLHHDPDSQSYSHAAKMVELGAAPAEIMQNCGLSRAEAELVARLHSRD